MPLNPGDIGFVQYSSDAPDNFAFVALVNITAGEEIKFTDRGWSNTNNSFGPSESTSEGTYVWTATVNVSAGTIVTIDVDTDAVDVGTISESGNVSLNGNGDQIIAFQGPDGTPTLIAAINAEGADPWQTGVTTNTFDSDLPTALTDGINAISIVEEDNGAYTGGVLTGDKTTLQAALFDINNWTTSDTAKPTFTGSFTDRKSVV